MTPNIIVVQERTKVKSQVFGKLVLHVESSVNINEEWLQIEELYINSFEDMYNLMVHDWRVEWMAADGTYHGTLIIQVSHTFDVCEEEAIYAANCAINELYVDVNEVSTNIGTLKVHNFSISWDHVYSV